MKFSEFSLITKIIVFGVFYFSHFRYFLSMKMSVEKEKLTWEISVGAMEDSKYVAMGKRENILPFQIIQLTQNEKMILAFRKVFNNRGENFWDFEDLHFFGV